MPGRVVGAEMNYRRANTVAKLLRADCPWLGVEVWTVAQGLAYIRVEGPLTRGIVQLVLHTEQEVAEFRRLARQWEPSAERKAEYRKLVADTEAFVEKQT